jgi:tetratricopeptide (TPR) repeat protein
LARPGPDGLSAAQSLATDALHLAETDPLRALVLADEVAAWPRPGEVSLLSQGLAVWARGRATRHLGRYREAQGLMEEAVALLGRSGDRSATARASVHLALERIDAGRFDEAVALLDVAAKDLSGTDAARAAVQRALALQRGGRIVDAKEDWDRALRAFSAAGLAVEAAICRESRGLVHAYRGELARAEADLAAAEKTFTRHGEHIRAVEAVHNRGFVAARRGDLPKALLLFDQAQSRASELGALRPAMLVDRVEVCLQAGLAAEARALAEAAVVVLEQSGLGADVPEVCLLAARACEQDGDPASAAEWARRAVELFGVQRRPRWELLARYAAVRAEAAAAPPTVDVARELAGTATELRKMGWARQASEAEVRVVEAFVSIGRLDEADEVVRRLVLRLPHTLPLGRLEVRLAQARLLWARGDARAAERALVCGLRALSAHQATLGSLELRAAGGGQAGELMATGIALARTKGVPSRALWWMEAVRTAQLGGVGGRQAGPEMDSALENLRDVMALQARDGLQSREATLLRRRQAALEEVVRRCSRHATGGWPPARTLGAPALARALGQRLLVEYAVVGRSLVAAVLYRKECRLVGLGGFIEVRQAVTRLRLALQAAIRQPGTGGQGLTEAATNVEKLVLGPLELPQAREVIVVADGVMGSTPWGALPRLAGTALVVAPSADALVRGQAGQRPIRASRPRVLVLIGPGLLHGDEEGAAVKAAWRGRARVLQGNQAQFAAARQAMSRADVVHIAAHGSFRAGNPLLSTVRLGDGPVTGEELARATGGARLVVLSCCDSGLADPNGLGLSRLLNHAGALAVVASMSPVSDASSVPLMEELHRQVAFGATPAAALVSARRRLTDPVGSASAAGFVCSGDGHTAVAGPKPPAGP